MKTWWFLILTVLFTTQARSQSDTLKLEECLTSARANFPLLQKQKLQDEQLELRLRSIRNTYLPQLFVTARASYQSDVPELDQPIFQLNIPKDQYRAALNFEQTVYDGGISSARRTLAEAENQAALQETEVKWVDMRNMVVNLFFAVAVQDHAEAILQTSINQLNARLGQLEAMQRSGSLLESEVLKVKSQILELEKQQITLQANRRAALESLSILTALDLGNVEEIEIPEVEKQIDPKYEELPAIQLIDLKRKQLEVTEKVASTSLVPKFSAFGVGGIAQPNPYNFFDTEFGTYYMVGIRMHWTITDWGDTKRTRTGLALQREMLTVEATQLKQNVQVKLTEKQVQINRLEEEAQRDGQIAEMRISIRETASRQLDEGTITPADYMEAVMDEQRAQLSKELNNLRLTKTWLEYIMESGNYQN